MSESEFSAADLRLYRRNSPKQTSMSQHSIRGQGRLWLWRTVPVVSRVSVRRLLHAVHPHWNHVSRTPTLAAVRLAVAGAALLRQVVARVGRLVAALRHARLSVRQRSAVCRPLHSRWVLLKSNCCHREKKERLKNESRFLHAADPSIHHGEELQRRGFGMYQGDPEPHKPLQRQDSHMHHHHEPHHHQHHDSHHGHHGNIPSLHSSQYQGMQQPHSGIRKHNAKY